MAERTADMVCQHLGVSERCQTREVPLTAYCPWTLPGRAPQIWLGADNPEDSLLCECEMVPRSAIDHIVQEILDGRVEPSLEEIGLRSRMGKGSCQGAFCGLRALSHLYERGELERAQGLDHLRAFLDSRWKGQRGVLWGTQLGQAELTEAMHGHTARAGRADRGHALRRAGAGALKRDSRGRSGTGRS
jgi:glycerol-3-phosphate dehydrogenase